MKKMLHYEVDGRPVDKEVNYIPFRFVLAILFADTLSKCIRIDENKIKWTLPQRFLRAVLKGVAPML